MTFPESVLAGASRGGVALIQVTLVALLGLLAWLAVRRSGPALRGAVLLATLVGLLVVPALAFVAPTWLPLPECVCPASAEPASRSASAAPTPPRPLTEAAVFAVQVKQPFDKPPLDPEDPTQKAGEATLAAGQAEAVVINLSNPPEEVPPPAPPAEDTRPAWHLVETLAAVWLLGALACLACSLCRLALLYRSVRRARPIRDKAWTDCLASLAGRDGLPPVALRESRAIGSPLTLGLFRPVILLPSDWRNWSVEERALVLGHELAHVRRRDFLAGLVAELVACLCWFHPLVRWLVGRLQLEQEYAADAWVASATNDSRAYVCCLARLALEQGRGRGSLAPALWRRRPEILRRIDMLQRNPRGLPPQLGKRAGWVVVVLAAAACLTVAGVGPLHSAADSQQTDASGSDAKDRPTSDSHGDPLPAGALARLGTTRLRHEGDVTYVAFGADGKTLLTAGQDGTIRLWDLVQNKEIRQFTRPRPTPPKPPKKGNQPVRPDNLMRLMAGARGGGSLRVALSPDGKTLAAVGGNTIQLWEVETGKDIRRIEGPQGGLTGLIFSPDGRTLAGRTADGALFLWAANNGKQIHHIEPARRKRSNDLVLSFGGGLAPVAPGMAFTPDGRTLVAAMTDYKEQKALRSIKFWEVTSGKEIRAIKLPDGGGARAMALTSNGKVLAYERGFTVHLCEANTGKEIRKIQIGGAALSLAFLPDGKTLVTRTRNQRVRLWDTQNGKEIRQLSEAAPPPRTGGGLVLVTDDFMAPEVRALALSADGKRIAAAAGNTVRVWDAATGKELPLVGGHWRAPSTVVVAPDGKSVVSWGADRVVRRWEAATGKSLGAFPAPPRTTLAAFSRDARLVALANADNTIRLHDTATGKELSRFKGPPNGLAALAFAPGGKVLALRGSGDNTARLYDVKRGVELRQIAIRPKPRQNQGTVIIFGGPARGPSGTGPGLAFSPDGKLLVAPLSRDGRSKTLVFLDAVSGKELRKIESAAPIASFAFSPDGRSLATENANRTITLWEVASGKAQGQLGKAVAGAPAGNRGMMATVVIDGLPGGSSVEPGGPIGVTYSPDGRMLAVRGADRAVHVWDVAASKEVGQLKGHTGRIETVAFAPNGKSLASGANDTTVLLWDVASSRKELSKPQTVRLSNEEVNKLWDTLAGEDAAQAHQSVNKLAAAPQQAVPFLGQRLKPAARVDAEKIKRWITDLDSEKFSVRREAAARLLKVGEQALPALRKTLASGPQLETRKRLEELVDKLTGGTLTAEEIRLVRAVEALERMGTPEAGKLLRTLAGGAPGALPTREAQAALSRLAGR